MQVLRTSCCAADLICKPKGFRRLLTRFQRGLCVGCLLSERLLDPEICGTTGFVTYTSPKDFNMKSAAVGNPQGASQGQTIDAPISVMFPALKRTLNRAKSTRPEFEVLVSKENGRVLQSPRKTSPSRVVSLSPKICLLLFLGNWERRLFAKSYPPPGSSLDRDPRCNITRSREWWGG